MKNNKKVIVVIIVIIALLILAVYYLNQKIFGKFEPVDVENIIGTNNTLAKIYKYQDFYYIIDQHHIIYKSQLTHSNEFIPLSSGIKVDIKYPRFLQLENGNIVFHSIDDNNHIVFKIFNPAKNTVIKTFKSVKQYEYNTEYCTYVIGNDILFSRFAIDEHDYFFEKYTDLQNKITLVKRNEICGMDNFVKLDNDNIMFFDIKSAYISNNFQNQKYQDFNEIKTTQLVSYILNLNTGEFKQHQKLHTDLPTSEEGFFGINKKLIKINENQLILFEFSEKTKTNYISLFEIKNQELRKIYTIKDTRVKYNLGASAITKLNDNNLLISGGVTGFNSMWFWSTKNSYLYNLNKRTLKRIPNSKYTHLDTSKMLKIAPNQVLIYDASFRNRKNKVEIEIYKGGKYGR